LKNQGRQKLRYSKFIHGFDPGESTGYVKFNLHEGNIESMQILFNYKGIHAILNTVEPGDILVFEKNVGKILTQDQSDMCKKVGYIEGYCEVNDFRYYQNTPSMRRGFRKIAERYIKNNFDKNSYRVHNIDAFAHVLWYLNKNGGIEKFK
jgi:hypothetical protein